MDKIKAKGFDCVIALIVLVVVLMSYFLTVESVNTIKELQGQENAQTESQQMKIEEMQVIDLEKQNVTIDFFRNAFVFLAPCALEGLTFLTSKKKDKWLLDFFEIIIGFFSIILTLYLWFAVSINVDLLGVSLIKNLLLMYPIKASVSLGDCFIELMKARGMCVNA